jgi:hypothetical protein
MPGRASVRRSTAISSKSIATIATIGIDIGKNSFHIVPRSTRRGRAAATRVTRSGPSAARRNAAVLTVSARIT